MLFVDLSSNNPHPINWGMVKGAGIDGAIVKATEGTDYVSPTFGSDYESALSAGLVVGAYHFWHPEADDDEQFDFFTHHYGPHSMDFPAVVDAEVNPTKVPWPTLAARLTNLCNRLAGVYGDCWAYMNRSWAANLGLRDRGIWLAQGSAGPVAGAEAMQFAPSPIPGIGGNTDWSYTAWSPR